MSCGNNARHAISREHGVGAEEEIDEQGEDGGRNGKTAVGSELVGHHASLCLRGSHRGV